MMYIENIKLAIRSLKTNLLRSLLTILIIMVGITALVGILTAIDTILYSLNDNFSNIGSNSSRSGQRMKISDPMIMVTEKDRIRDQFQGGRSVQGKISLSGCESICFSNYFNDATVKFQNLKTNPNMQIMGIDDNFVEISKLDIENGRYFNSTEQNEGLHKVVLGNGIYKTLFKDKNQSGRSGC